MTTIAATRPVAVPAEENAASMLSHPFTCVTCAIAFRSSELQRTHMRSDWHRYNLKRRVASLPPLSSEIFAEKVMSAQASSADAAAKAAFEKTCPPCQKTYYSENAYQNHLGSQKHRVKLAAASNMRDETDTTASLMSSTLSLGEPETASTDGKSLPIRSANAENSAIAAETGSSAAATGETESSGTMPINRCLFCNYDSPNLKLSINHMTKFHGMFIPEQAYLTDLEGLISYLQEKVAENHECLSCHKLKYSAAAVQTHMRDKGHCMIAFDSEEEMVEIGQFYDFSSTYSDDEEQESTSDSDESLTDKEETHRSGKLGAKRVAKDKDKDAEDGWESDSSASSLDSDDIDAIPIDKRRPIPQKEPRAHRAPDGYHSHAHRHAAFRIDDELHLPSGRTAGHRSLARYFRQNLHNYPLPEERAQRAIAAGSEDSDESLDDAPAGRGRQVANRTEGGMLGVTDEKKKKVLSVAQKQQRNAARVENQYQSRVERRANKQKYFRDDNFGIYR